jgi:citrate lyase beta subunit
VQVRFKEPALLEAECRVANAMGYTGKQIIHPAQVEITQRLFTPTPEVLQHLHCASIANVALDIYLHLSIDQLRWNVSSQVVARAQRMIAAFKASAADNKGALQLDGEMVDAANVKVAQAILARAGQIVDL